MKPHEFLIKRNRNGQGVRRKELSSRKPSVFALRSATRVSERTVLCTPGSDQCQYRIRSTAERNCQRNSQCTSTDAETCRIEFLLLYLLPSHCETVSNSGQPCDDMDMQVTKA